MHFHRLLVGLFALAALCLVSPIPSAGQTAPKAKAQVIPHHQDVPPGPALSPQEAMAKMKVPEGFKVELVASEPDIVNPVAMTFDEKGRIWITESLEYPRKAPGPGRDRIKVLEDTDGDGKADKFSIFAEGLNIPSGIAVGHGGVWVANAPDILFYPDADRDGKADGKPEVVVTGFGRADTHELPNSFTWGPDGWLYGLNGVFNHSHVKYGPENGNYKADHPGWPITCALYRIHPVTREFQVFCEGTSNPWGVAIDGEGSFFISACVIDHLWHLVETGYYHRQGGPYPPFTWKIESIVKHKHQKAAYCGIHWFDSDAYPEQYRGKLYMGNIHGNCINVDSIRREGSTYFGTGEPDFLSANDAWFMPVVQKTGPDGCLYILDWYDQYHCYQDANRDPAGIDRLKGRLYRVRYKDSPRAVNFDLSKETDEQLLKRLEAKNDFIRHTAQRVLVERLYDPVRPRKLLRSEDSQALLCDVALTIDAPRQTRLHALWTMISSGPLTKETLRSLLSADDPLIRAWGVRAAGNQQKADAEIVQKLRELTADRSPDVKLQVAIAARKVVGLDPMTTLVAVLANAGDDKLIPHVVWQNLHPLLEENTAAFLSAAKQPEFLKSPHAAEFLPRAAERILGRKEFDASPVANLIEITRDAAPKDAQRLLALLSAKVQSGELRGDQLKELQNSLAASLQPLLADPALHPAGDEAALLAASWGDERGIKRAREAFSLTGLQNAYRLRALAALISGGDEELLPRVAKALAGEVSPVQSPVEFRGQLLDMLGKLDDPKVADVVLSSYGELELDARPRAIQLLTQRTAWANKLLAAIGEKTIPAEALNVNQVRQLLQLGDKDLSAAVSKHWGSVRTTRDPAREAFVGEMRRLVRNTPGDARRGIEVFSRVCGQCHKIHGQGQDVGPDITLNGRASFEQLLSNVFDPSLVIGNAYQARIVQTTDGRVITGLTVEDSPQRIVLKVQGGKLETIARDEVDASKVSELSLMPEGIEKQLQPQEIADLFAFITLDKHPDDPTARPIPSGR
jgi:putative membrane-bound dehydrogenase-like protein